MKKVTVGKIGDEKKVDCNIEFELRDKGGLHLEISSKVDVMYGSSIRKLIADELEFLGIENAKIYVEDYGAYPFVIMARLETAVRRAFPRQDKSYLPEFSEKSKYSSDKERLRRTRLYLPGNYPKFMINAGLHEPDGIILDLEDSVAPEEKDAARVLVRNALRTVDFYGAERMVRINQIPEGLEDLDWVIPHNTHLILIPKCESPDDIITVNSKIDGIKEEQKLENEVYIMPIIESALGVENAFEIASAADNIVALAIGLEDYTADIGAERTREGRESFFARSKLVNAARAAGIQPIDTVFSDVDDDEGLRKSTEESRSMGFAGKGCIHPRQIGIIHEVFAPSEDEIENALKIVKAFEDAQEKGLSVVSIGGKMIDPPVVKRAQRIVDIAIESGKLDKDWRNNE